MGKDSGMIYKSFVSAVRKLDADTQMEAMFAYCDYLFDGIEYEGDNPVVDALLTVMKPSIEKAQNRYEAACENGKKGGRPKTRTKPEQNQNKTRADNSGYEGQNLTDAVAVADTDAEDDTEDVDVDENIPCAPAGASPLPYTLSQQVKQKVVKEGDLTDLANETWIEPANLKQIGKDIYVTTKHFRAAMHIRDRYGGYFENAIRSVIPDTGAILYATG